LGQNCDKQYFSIQHIRDPCHPNQPDTNLTANCGNIGIQILIQCWLYKIYDKEDQKESGENGLMSTSTGSNIGHHTRLSSSMLYVFLDLVLC
jgi:hypothetical protein